jgi:hypothetical protein
MVNNLKKRLDFWVMIIEIERLKRKVKRAKRK